MKCGKGSVVILNLLNFLKIWKTSHPPTLNGYGQLLTSSVSEAVPTCTPTEPGRGHGCVYLNCTSVSYFASTFNNSHARFNKTGTRNKTKRRVWFLKSALFLFLFFTNRSRLILKGRTKYD